MRRLSLYDMYRDKHMTPRARLVLDAWYNGDMPESRAWAMLLDLKVPQVVQYTNESKRQETLCNVLESLLTQSRN